MHRRRPRRADLIAALESITGRRYVLTREAATRRYRIGFRFGGGNVAAVVRPGSLIEQWRVLRACVAANVIVIAQAANTGLTGGSTPDGDDYDRDIVIISTTRMQKVHVIDGGKQVVCLPGARLDQLEQVLKPLGREPHSVIGSSCIGASVIGGICNNSGGALVRRGPAYTEMALFARVDADGELRLVNHLGMRLGETSEEILDRLERGEFTELDIQHEAAGSDREYAHHVRDIDAGTPARFNADARRLYEASGSAGKIVVFAVRLDTFPAEVGARVFYVGTNDPRELTALRRHILRDFAALPIAAEYVHRDAFDMAERYGKDTFLLIEHFGTRAMPRLFALKSWCDAYFDRLSDRLLQSLGKLFPSHLPPRLKDYRQRFEHHLMLKVAADSARQTHGFLSGFFTRATGSFFECTNEEGRKAFLHRFAVAGAAVRYRAVHAAEVEDILALDIALRRNELDWFEQLPAALEAALSRKLYYGHFLCHVFHHDYIVRKGADCEAIEHEMCRRLDARGAQYPAEHNVGHLYEARPALKQFYRELDPCNCFNAGIGRTSKRERYS